MRAPRKPAHPLVGIVLAGMGLASCMLDLAGLTGAPSVATTSSSGGTTGSGGAPTTATGAGGGTSTASSSGGSGGAGSVCGNSILEGDEGCDDGALFAFDGCSPTCTIEPLDTCPGVPIALAPPGITIQGTLTGAANDVAPSCGTNSSDVIYEVTPTKDGTLKLTLSGDYAKSLSVRSSCADSPLSELDCSAGTTDLTLRLWVYAGTKYTVIVDAAAHLFSLRLDLFACGNAVKEELEDCDDPADPSCTGCVKCSGAGNILDPVSHHCYRRIASSPKRDWKSARHECITWGGDLVGVSSLAEANFLKVQPGFDDLWTGATDVPLECQFSWINGEPWQPRWRNNEPNNANGNENCGLFFASGDMDDRSCDENHDALCERTPGGACGDKIVQPGEECDDALPNVGVTCHDCKITCLPGETEDPATHHCYRYVTGPRDWTGAMKDCADKGAYLAAITSPTENALLKLKLPVPMWIGGSRLGHPLAWVNTDVFCFTNWDASSPSTGNDCAMMELSGSWSTDACTQSKGYICERDN